LFRPTVRVLVAGGEVLRQGATFHTLDAPRILAAVATLSEAFDRWRATAPALRGAGANA
jgi:hypothetical protein